MVNFMCCLDSSQGAQIKHYFWMSVRVFLDGICIWIGGLRSVDCLLQREWVSNNCWCPRAKGRGIFCIQPAASKKGVCRGSTQWPPLILGGLTPSWCQGFHHHIVCLDFCLFILQHSSGYNSHQHSIPEPPSSPLSPPWKTEQRREVTQLRWVKVKRRRSPDPLSAAWPLWSHWPAGNCYHGSQIYCQVPASSCSLIVLNTWQTEAFSLSVEIASSPCHSAMGDSITFLTSFPSWQVI